MLSCRLFLSVVALLCSQLAWAQLTLSGTVTSVSCANYSNGTINVTVTGGTEPYSYSWSNGLQTKDISNLGAGEYTVTVNDQQGNAASASFIVAQPAPLYSTGTVVHPSCASAGSISLTTTGGQAPYQYQWSTGATTATISNLQPGGYWVTIFDSNGCTTENKFWLNSPGMTIAHEKEDADCSGTNVSIKLTVTGGQQPYTYEWSNGLTTKDISGLSAGEYTVKVTDAAGCTQSSTIPVFSPADYTATFSVIPSTMCSTWSGNGYITTYMSGGNAPFLYLWDDMITNDSRRGGLKAGIHSLRIVDGNGCTSDPYMIEVPLNPTLPQIILTSTPNEACDPAYFTGSISASISDIEGSSYHYTLYIRNADAFTPVLSASNQTATALGFTQLAAASYRLEVTTSASGCTQLADVDVLDYLDIPVITATSTAAQTHCSVGNGFASIDGIVFRGLAANLADYTYTWTDADGALLSARGASVTGLQAGTYSVMATKSTNPGAGCTSAPFEVVVPYVPEMPGITLRAMPNTACNALAFNGEISAEITLPSAAYTWSWSTSNGAVLATGTESSTAHITGLAPGVYELTVTSANTCATTKTITVTEEMADYTIAFQKGDVTCSGGNEGWVTVEQEVGYSYELVKDGLQIVPNDEGMLAGLAAGAYELKATNTNTGCVYATAVVLAQPSPILLSETIQQVSAYGVSDGSIQLTVEGGTAPYQYLWSNGATSSGISGLSPQTYSVTVTDAQQCSHSLSVVIEAPLSLRDELQVDALTVSRTSAGNLRVQFAKVLNAHDLKIYSLDGRLVSFAALKGQEDVEVQMPVAAPALYLMVLTSKGKVHKKKIVF